MSIKIDINCDVAEGINNEHLLLPYISSCNIACGAHAGSVEIIDKVIALAIENNVKIGAHPSFPDRENFGRKVMSISNDDLQKSIENQIGLIQDRAKLQQQKINHIKPHGALYNIIAKDKTSALIVLKAIKKTTSNAYLYAPYNSVIATEAINQNIKVKYEAFADRNYNNDLSLVSRTNENAVIQNKNRLIKHLESMIFHNEVITVNQIKKKIKADTFCVHGDTKNAIELVQFIHQSLTKKGIEIA